MVLEVATDDVRDIFRRVRKSRRAAGWRPCWAMELDAALQDVRGLLYLLVEVGVPTPMKLWALTRAAEGIWATPSQNVYDGISTADVALRILGLENDRAYNERFRTSNRYWSRSAAGWRATDRWNSTTTQSSCVTRSWKASAPRRSSSRGNCLGHVP